MLQRATISKFSLDAATKKVINSFEVYRIKQFKKYIINANMLVFIIKILILLTILNIFMHSSAWCKC